MPTRDRTPPLHVEESGRGSAVVLVHGFTQTRACWEPVASALGADHRVVRPDAPGHGRSGHDDADLWEAAELLAATAPVGIWVGYSMGGRMALHVALAHPAAVERLVLIGATPGIREDEARAARARRDDALAARLERLGTEAFLEEWLAQPLFSGLAPERACREARLENRAEGLATSLRRAGTGRQDPLWDRLGELAMPVLWVTGGEDRRFGAIAAEAAAGCLEGTHRILPGVGHTAHLEDPEGFLAALDAWLRATVDPGGAQAER